MTTPDHLTDQERRDLRRACNLGGNDFGEQCDAGIVLRLLDEIERLKQELEILKDQHGLVCEAISDQVEEINRLRAEVERLRECLEPGKASAIIDAMFAEAERLGHSPFSAKHALTFLVEEINRLRAELAHMHEYANVMHEAAENQADEIERLREEMAQLRDALHYAREHVLRGTSHGSWFNDPRVREAVAKIDETLKVQQEPNA